MSAFDKPLATLLRISHLVSKLSTFLGHLMGIGGSIYISMVTKHKRSNSSMKNEGNKLHTGKYSQYIFPTDPNNGKATQKLPLLLQNAAVDIMNIQLKCTVHKIM